MVIKKKGEGEAGCDTQSQPAKEEGSVPHWAEVRPTSPPLLALPPRNLARGTEEVIGQRPGAGKLQPHGGVAGFGEAEQLPVAVVLAMAGLAPPDEPAEWSAWLPLRVDHEVDHIDPPRLANGVGDRGQRHPWAYQPEGAVDDPGRQERSQGRLLGEEKLLQIRRVGMVPPVALRRAAWHDAPHPDQYPTRWMLDIPVYDPLQKKLQSGNQENGPTPVVGGVSPVGNRDPRHRVDDEQRHQNPRRRLADEDGRHLADGVGVGHKKTRTLGGGHGQPPSFFIFRRKCRF